MLPSVRYNYVQSRYLEGTLPGAPHLGTWMISYNRTQFGWGQIPEQAYPRLVDDAVFFGPIPPAIDLQAKRGRVHHYQLVRDSQEARRIARRNPDIQSIARRGKGLPPPEKRLEMKVAFEFTRQFVEAPRGLIEQPVAGAPILGSHSVPIVGMSEPRRSFIISNSWGPAWGDGSLGFMPFEFFDRFMVESWLTDERKPKFPAGDRILEWRWDVPDPLASGSRLFGLEIYDPTSDERIGWSFAVLRDGFLDLEELFVRPAYRRLGYGVRLVSMIQDLAKNQGLPIRAWIPYADVDKANRPALAAVLSKLGLGVRRSGVRWAAYEGTPQEPSSLHFPIIRIPQRPAATPDEGKELAHVETLRGTVLKYDDPFSPAVAPEDWEAAH